MPCGAPTPKEKWPLHVIMQLVYFFFPSSWKLLLIQSHPFFNILKSSFESTLGSFVLCQGQDVVPLLRHAKQSKKSFWSLLFPPASTAVILKNSILRRRERAQITCIVIHSNNMLGFYSSKWRAKYIIKTVWGHLQKEYQTPLSHCITPAAPVAPPTWR